MRGCDKFRKRTASERIIGVDRVVGVDRAVFGVYAVVHCLWVNETEKRVLSSRTHSNEALCLMLSVK